MNFEGGCTKIAFTNPTVQVIYGLADFLSRMMWTTLTSCLFVLWDGLHEPLITANFCNYFLHQSVSCFSTCTKLPAVCEILLHQLVVDW